MPQQLGRKATFSGLDVDGNGSVDALTDGVLITRLMFGVRGEALTEGAIGTYAFRSEPYQIVDAYFAGNSSRWDVDGDGRVSALTDGVLITRYMFGVRNYQLVQGALGSGAKRTNPYSIVSYLDNL